jgi:hypothetical protein
MPIAIVSAILGLLGLLQSGATTETVVLAAISAVTQLIDPATEAKVLGAVWSEIESVGGAILAWAKTRGAAPGPTTTDEVRAEVTRLREAALQNLAFPPLDVTRPDGWPSGAPWPRHA